MKRFEEGFWLLVDKKWVKVTKATYVAAERAAGFYNTLGQPDEPATAAFIGNDGSCGSTLNPDREK
jgi:hypothetical protein